MRVVRLLHWWVVMQTAAALVPLQDARLPFLFP
jgi:hypothetical protein